MGSEGPSLLSYTLIYTSVADFGRRSARRIFLLFILQLDFGFSPPFFLGREKEKRNGRGGMTKREVVLWIAVWIVYHTQTLGTGTCSICRPAKSRSSVYGLLRLRGGRASPPRSMAAKRSTSETKTASTKKSSFVKERKSALPRSSGNAEQAKDDEEAIRQELMATFGDMKVNITSS